MKKFIYSIFMLCALFITQNVNAQKQVIYEETFAEGLGEFTAEGYNIWTNENNSVKMICIAAIPADGNTNTNYLVSPIIAAGTENTVSFDHEIEYCWFYNMQTRAKVYVRIEGGDWVELSGVNYPVEQGVKSDFVSSGEIVIPQEYENKNIQVAFGYTPNTVSDQDTWYIKNFKFSGVPSTDPDPTPSEGNVIYNVVFDSQENVNTWAVEGPVKDLLYFNSSKGFVSLCHAEGNLDETYFVSPKIALASNNKVSFDNTQSAYSNNDASVGIALVVRTTDGAAWEKLEGVTFGTEYPVFVNSGEIAVPAKYDGKEVQFAFECKFAQEDQSAGTFFLKNFTVKGESVDTGIQNVENTVADNKYYDLQGRVVENPAKGLYIHNGKKIIVK